MTNGPKKPQGPQGPGKKKAPRRLAGKSLDELLGRKPKPKPKPLPNATKKSTPKPIGTMPKSPKGRKRVQGKAAEARRAFDQRIRSAKKPHVTRSGQSLSRAEAAKKRADEAKKRAAQQQAAKRRKKK